MDNEQRPQVQRTRMGTGRHRNKMDPLPPSLLAYIAGLKAHDVAKIASALAGDLRFITPTATVNKERFLAFLRSLYGAFPDWHYDHDEPEFAADEIAVKWRQSGTHSDIERVQRCLLGAHVLQRANNLTDAGEERLLDQPLLDGLGSPEVDHLRHRLVVVRAERAIEHELEVSGSELCWQSGGRQISCHPLLKP